MSSSSRESGFFHEDSVDYSDYWQEIDRISEQFRQLAQQEERYIFEREFELPNQKYKIVTGFSAARGYIPAVRLLANTVSINKTDHISFAFNEWTEYISYLQQMMSYFHKVEDDADYTEICFEIDYIKISSSMCLDMKMVKVDNGVYVFYLSELVVREMINLHEKLIDAQLFILHEMDFDVYYNNFLESANDLLCKSNYNLNPESVMLNLYTDKMMSNSQPFALMQLYCISECLFYNRDKVLNDLDRKMYLQHA